MDLLQLQQIMISFNVPILSQEVIPLAFDVRRDGSLRTWATPRIVQQIVVRPEHSLEDMVKVFIYPFRETNRDNILLSLFSLYLS